MRLATLILLASPFALAADSAAEVWDVVATMAAALAEPNDAAFMKPVAKSFDQHDLLGRNVLALVQANEIVSSISPGADDGDEKQRIMEVDWYIEIQPRNSAALLIRRRETVKLTLVKTGKRWMITSLSPVTFFAPPATN